MFALELLKNTILDIFKTNIIIIRIVLLLFVLRSSSCRTDISIHFQPSRPTTIWMIFFSYPYVVFCTFYYATDHRKCEMTLGGWHCCLRLFKLGRLLHTGFEPRSLEWPERYHTRKSNIFGTLTCFLRSGTCPLRDIKMPLNNLIHSSNCDYVIIINLLKSVVLKHFLR